MTALNERLHNALPRLDGPTPKRIVAQHVSPAAGRDYDEGRRSDQRRNVGHQLLFQRRHT
jgi:hypothetical protein